MTTDLKYAFPNEQRVYETLRANVFGLESAIQAHQRRFANAIGSRTLNANSVNLLWQQVTVDIVGSPFAIPQTSDLLNSMFTLSMVALIVPTPTTSPQDANAFLRAVLDVRKSVAVTP